MKALYDMVFREYPGHLGFGPAVLTLALGIAVGGALIYGGVVVGKAAFAHTTVETGHS